jgi:hypothetical protein
MYEYRALKTVKVILRRGVEEEEDNGGDELNQGTMHVYVKISQHDPPYSYHVLRKMFQRGRKFYHLL